MFKPKERYISEKEMHMRSKRYLVLLCEVEKVGEGGVACWMQALPSGATTSRSVFEL